MYFDNEYFLNLKSYKNLKIDLQKSIFLGSLCTLYIVYIYIILMIKHSNSFFYGSHLMMVFKYINS